MEKSSIDLLKKVSKIVDNIINNKKKGEKEMKLKTKKILASIIICIMLLFQTGIVNAAYTVGVRGLRDDPERVQRVVETLPNTSGEQVPTEGDTIPYAYILEGTKMIWKLLDYSSGEASWDTAIYCLDQGVGFGTSGASREEVEAERVLYNTSEVMQIKKRSIQNLAAQNTNSLANYSVLSAMNDIDTYNRVLWILDHCFLPKSVHREELRKELLTNMLTFKDENEDTGILDDIDLSAVGSTPEEILLTDNDIEMVQQAAIWYFTNFSEEANWTGLPSVTLEDASEAEKNLSDIGLRVTDEGAMREAEAALLYKYFITQAVEEQAQYSIERELVPTLTMENTNVTIEKTGNNTLIGPFKYVIVENGKKVFNYSLEVNAATNNTSLNPVSNYTIKKSDKTTTANNIEEVKNQDFYILIEDENITNVEIKVKTKYYKPTVTKWTAEGTGREEQPIAIISEQEFDLEASKGAELKKFDLALRKFISGVNEEEVTNRVPQVSYEDGKIVYTHTKEPVVVKNGDTVIYTLRVYNEGEVAGYAEEIKDLIPEGTEFLPEHEINTKYGWKMYKIENEVEVETDIASEATILRTDYLSKASGEGRSENTLINAFNSEGGITEENPDYQEVKIAVKVIAPSTTEGVLRNIAEISEDANENGDPIDDIDSTPDNYPEDEDDEDYDDIVLTYFDLALRKFISGVNEEEITNRVPQVSYEDGKIVYTHTKEPVVVKNGDTVIYTLRVYNEGEVAGYAEEIKDLIPEGTEFLPEHEINTKYGWKMYKIENEVEVETDIASEATILRTDYLSKASGEGRSENTLINAFNSEGGITEENPDYQEVKIAVKVIAPSTTEGVLRNIAEISEDANENGDPIDDIDSTPDNYPEDEDDDDYDDIVLTYFDLALRKFITKINDKEITDRIPEVDITSLNKAVDGQTITTAEYSHPKNPVSVQKGDIVTYTIRIYNEGELDGYAEEIADYIPEGLGYLVQHNTNFNNSWQLPNDGSILPENLMDVTNRLDNINLDEFTDVESLEDILVVPGNAKITTNKLKKTEGNTNNLLEAFNGTELDYKDVQVTCIVLEDETSDRILTNVAEITKDLDEEGNEITDRDSEPDSVIIDEYPVNSNVQDDDDYEKLMLTYFDLALRKFITGVNEEEITDRVPQITMENEELVYNHTKEPIAVRNGDTVIYTLRIYNEGKMAGYAEEIKDLIPEGTEFLPEHEINIQYGWRMYKIENDEEIETTDATEATIVRTDYLSKAAGETRGEDNLLKAFDNIAEITPEGTFYHPDYRDVKIAVKIIEPNTSEEVLRNIAEISEDADEEGEPVDDVDSTPDNYPEEEDDNDYDDVVLTYFDLALRKFITSIRDLDVEEEVTERIPQVSYEDGKIVYTHPKDPILVANGNIVTYTIRVYNEGKMDGYASEITDDIPEGLEFLPEHETNKQYGWVVSEDGTKVTTNYLSKEASEARGEDNLIKAFDPEADVTEENPDYRDVKIAFKVTEEQLPEDRILINTAEISDDSDEDGNEIEDEDSIPGNNEPEEDDIDIEKVQVKYFDLSLLKYVSKVITIENGETQIKETGYDGTEDPEPIVKVDLHRKKVDEVTVKFGYTIKITNEGQIPGYATEIKDYVPEGLEFLPEDNPDWLEIENGIIVTEKLAETLLQPGESATVEVILTWINDEDNMGLKTNIAEISKDDNEYDSDDIDSTPDNKEEGEDDIDEALVMLSISTGGESKVYIVLSGIILVTIAAGIVLIKKFVI